MAETGNVILNTQEILKLRMDIIDRFEALSGIKVNSRHFNSNTENYIDLYQHIDTHVSLKSAGISGTTALVSVFHSGKKESQDSVQPKAFRRGFVNKLYTYCYGCDRDAFLSMNPHTHSPEADKQSENLIGYWQAYYQRNDNPFYRPQDTDPLSVLGIRITGDNTRDCSVYFLQSDTWSKGTLEIKGSNLIFQFRNEKNNHPNYLIMNCGACPIHEREKHIDVAIGGYLYINDAGMPRTTSCYMEYFDRQKLIEKFGMTEEDLLKKDFRPALLVDSKINIKEMFSSQAHFGYTG